MSDNRESSRLNNVAIVYAVIIASMGYKFYSSHNKIMGEIEGSNSRISNLEDQLYDANSKIDEMQSKIESLELELSGLE